MWRSWVHFWSSLHGFLELWMRSQKTLRFKPVRGDYSRARFGLDYRYIWRLRMNNRLQLKELFGEIHHAKYTVHSGTKKDVQGLEGTYGGRIYERMWQSMSPTILPVSK